MKRAAKMPTNFPRCDFAARWVLPLLGLISFALAGAAPIAAYGQLELITNKEAQCVFAGDAQKISIVWHNPGDNTMDADIRMRLLQTSSATTVRLGETPWKTLHILPRQTVLESAQLDFPAVEAETKFLVQWLVNSNSVVGRTEVRVYPTNLLDELKLLVDEGGKNLGVLDPKNQIKPALKSSAVKFADLAETGLDDFSGRLAIIGPCGPDDPEWNNLANRISKLAEKGTPVVWIQSPPPRRAGIWPSFWTVPKNQAVVVVARPELVAALPDNPQSQLNLIYFCRLALNPTPPALPDLSPQP
jgi:hypothetical protein